MRRLAALVVVFVLAMPGAGPTAANGLDTRASVAAAGTIGSSRSTLDDLESRFLTRRPPVGATWTVQIGAGSPAERLTMRTLQGIVNRTAARLYLLEPADSGASRWIDDYEARGLVDVVGTTDIEGALDLFASEAAGYVLADETEPWTLDVAATIATAEGGIVATPGQVAGLEARGLSLLDDVRGRWSDAATAYEEVVAAYRDVLPYDGIAIVRPTDALFDFTTQQGILTIFTRPNDATWPRMKALIESFPDGHAVYGYLSDTGEEEAIAVATLSAAGMFLVPTDTTRNLSFQVAVGADRPRVVAPTPPVDDVEPCTNDTVNVVVGMSDGDNLNVPLNHFVRGDNWGAPQRGTLPLGWSIGPSLAVLAPAAWDAYAREVAPSDELVAMIGYGYAAPAVLPDPEAFYADSFSLMSELGMRSFWSLGGGLETPTGPGWAALDAGAGDGPPTGVLVGYGNGSGVGTAFYSPAGRPAFTSGTAYSETPAQIAAQVQALVDMPPAGRPTVAFLSATNWSNPAADLIDALAPFEAAGVRFLTPSEASACVPPAPEVVPPVRTPGVCLPDEPITTSGLQIISDTTRGEITAYGTRVEVPTTVTATSAVAAGGTIEYEATASIDVPRLTGRILEERVRPIVAGGFGAELATTAWLTMAFEDMTLGFTLADGTAASGAPTVTSTGAGATASWGADGVEVRLDPLAEDTRAPGEPFELRVRWTAVAAARPAAFTAEVEATPLAYDLELTIGVLLGTTPLTGAVTAPWWCGAAEVGASTSVAAAPPESTTTSTTTTPLPTAPPPTSTPPTSTPPTSTPTTPPPTTAAATAAPTRTATPAFTG